MAKIDIAGELNAATTERIVADSAQIRFQNTTVEKAMVTYGDLDGTDDVPGGGGGEGPEPVTASIPTILLSELDTLTAGAVTGSGDSIYKVRLTENGVVVGILQMFSDNMAHVASQVFITHYTNPGTWLIHNDDEVYIYCRSYALQETTTIPQGTWSQWRNFILPSITNLLPPYATSTKYGTVKLGSDVVQAIAAEEPQSEPGRTYPVQKDGDGKLVVNVPGGSESSSVLVFDGIEEGEITILDRTPADFTRVIWSSHNKKFAAKTADGQYYSNWPSNERYGGSKNEYEDGNLFVCVPKSIAPTVGFTNGVYAKVAKEALGGSYTTVLEKVAEVNIAYSNATPSADGQMSKEDKSVLDSLPSGILDSIDPFTATADAVSFNYYSIAKKGDKPYGGEEQFSEDIPAATHTSAGVMTAADKVKVDSALTGDGVASVKVVTVLPEVQEANTLYIVIAEEA